MISFNLLPLLPELFMAGAGMALLLGGVFGLSPRSARYGACAVFAIAFLLVFGLFGREGIVLNGMFRTDVFSSFLKVLILIGLAASLALAGRYLEQEKMDRCEYAVLTIFAGTGMMLMVSANNLLSVYMSMELQSLSLYVLAAFRRDSVISAEAGIKYFILGALSSGMLLFGISLIYGFTGSLDYGAIRAAAMAGGFGAPQALTFGLVFMLCGLIFKISAAPFHMWTPDVYQGAPTSVTALFAIVPKIAAMGLIMRLLYGPLYSLAAEWQQIVWFASALSMVVGSFAALAQGNIKRLIAYSAIGNIGYALIGIAAGGINGISSALLYLLIYMITTAGIFGFIFLARREGRVCENIDDLCGLSRSRPALAYMVAILMFSLAGIPPMAGFFGKLFIFQAAISHGLYVLAVLGVLSSVVAAYYCIRIVKIIFFDDPAPLLDRSPWSLQQVVLALSTTFTLVFIIAPSFFVAAAQQAAASLFFG